MPVLRLSEIHAAHVERIARTWAEGPSSDEPDEAEFKPMLVAVCRDRKKRTVERVMVAPTPEARVEAAEEFGRTVTRDGLKPFAVTQATEAWMGANDGREAPSERADRREVLAIATAQADGRSLTTIRAVVRSEGGESALGEVVTDAETGYEAGLSAEVFRSYRLSNNGHGGGY